jgi:hypothetical protein
VTGQRRSRSVHRRGMNIDSSPAFGTSISTPPGLRATATFSPCSTTRPARVSAASHAVADVATASDAAAGLEHARDLAGGGIRRLRVSDEDASQRAALERKSVERSVNERRGGGTGARQAGEEGDVDVERAVGAEVGRPRAQKPRGPREVHPAIQRTTWNVSAQRQPACVPRRRSCARSDSSFAYGRPACER